MTPSRSYHWVGATIALLFLIVCFFWSKSKPESWNDIARIATIESLVERGTWSIDNSQWVELTKDKVYLNGRFYSDKMPLLSALGAGIYWVFHGVLGMTLAPDCTNCAYRWVTFVLIGIPASITVFLFFLVGHRISGSIWAAILATLALGFGTMMLPYALVFNHHLPAACALLASFFVLTSGKSKRVWLIIAGALAGLAISFDILSGIISASVLVMWLARKRIEFAWVVVGLAIPVLVTAALDVQISGTVIPPYMITNGYDFEGSEFPPTFGGNGTPDDYAAYAFRMFLGGQGLFAYNPLLLFAIAGAVFAAMDAKSEFRVEGALAAVGFLSLCVYLALGTGNYGGTAYGERWFVPAIPVLFTFLTFAPPLKLMRRRDPAWLVFLPMLALGFLSTIQGAQAPWQYSPPPLQMTRKAELPIFGFKWNLP